MRTASCGHPGPVYFDHQHCQVCGAEVRLEPRTEPHAAEADGTVDKRVCTNPDCETNTRSGDDAPTP